MFGTMRSSLWDRIATHVSITNRTGSWMPLMTRSTATVSAFLGVSMLSGSNAFAFHSALIWYGNWEKFAPLAAPLAPLAVLAPPQLLLLLAALLPVPLLAGVLPSGGFTYPMLTMSSSCMSAWRTIRPGLSSTPKHRSISREGKRSDGTCRTVMHTSLSVRHRNRKLDLTSRGTVT